MRIYAIDDEPKMRQLLHRAIAEAAPEAEILDFAHVSEVMDAIADRDRLPDVVFSDIRMPGMDGLELAVRIKRAAPDAKIVFVTGYSSYAVDAYRLHASGYILKPVDAARIREELDNLAPAPAAETGKLSVRCFGNFDVFWQGKPLLFGRKQTRELFAFLIDREGKVCTAEEISTALWEDEPDMHVTKSRIRKLISDMRSTLASIGMENLLIRRSGQTAIRRDMVDCDYYRMLDGDVGSVNAFHGVYMAQYSWAELTEGRLHFREESWTS